MVAQGTEERAAAHALKEARLPESEQGFAYKQGSGNCLSNPTGSSPLSLVTVVTGPARKRSTKGHLKMQARREKKPSLVEKDGSSN